MRQARSVSYPEDLRALVDDASSALRFSTAPATAGLEEAMRYSLLAGGKRVRPVLALATARALGAEPERFLPAAAAIELIHTYSLIHDDLPAMDDDELRRGQPDLARRVRRGRRDPRRRRALRRGGAALLRAAGRAGDRVLAALRELSAATGVDGMVGGQYVDVAGDAARRRGAARAARAEDRPADRRQRRRRADPRGLPEPETIPYRRFADELGVLFQIVDDILDVTGSDEELGKPHGSDERHGKLTYVSLFGLERARELAAESHAKATEALAEAERRDRTT